MLKESAVRVTFVCKGCDEEHTLLLNVDEEPLTPWHCNQKAELRGLTTLYEVSDDDEKAGQG